MAQPKQRGKIFIGIAVVLAVATGMALYSYLSSLESPPASDTVPVVFAREPISARTVLNSAFLTQGKLEVREVPVQYIPKSSIVAPLEAQDDLTSLNSILGDAVVMTDLAAGDILQANQLDRNAGLGPEMRAVGLAVNQVTSVGGTVRPGNRVDIVVSYEREDEEGSRIPVTELLLQDVEVLAVYGAATSYYAQPPAGMPAEEAGFYGPAQETRFTPEGEMMKDTTVTLALNPRDALRLTYASNFAKEVRLMIRRLDDKAPVQTESITPHTFPSE